MQFRKINRLLLTTTMMFLTACGGNSADDHENHPEDRPISDFVLGADISWVTEMESRGDKFYNTAGEERECTALMKECGMNAIRLRVWVDPSEHQGWCGLEDLLVKARRAKALDMDLLIDFHYSDWWADPGQQNIPASWKNHSYPQMKTAVARHTTEVLQALQQNGIVPRWIQIGNETRNGFLWPMGHAQKHPEQYAGLFKAGYEAAKQVFPKALVMVHLDNGFDNDMYNWNLDILKNNGASWDMIGLSVYPYWAMKANAEPSADQTITDCIRNINLISHKYHCDVMIVETGVECADDRGHLASIQVLLEGRRQLQRIIKESREQTGGRCKGVFYWEPECKPGTYRLGAFTAQGKPTVIMEAFQQ